MFLISNHTYIFYIEKIVSYLTTMVAQSVTHALPWVEKYRPEYFIDFVGNKEAVKSLENWLKTWNQQRKKVALLAGPAGVGKTSVVYYLIKKYKYEGSSQ